MHSCALLPALALAPSVRKQHGPHLHEVERNALRDKDATSGAAHDAKLLAAHHAVGVCAGPRAGESGGW